MSRPALVLRGFGVLVSLALAGAGAWLLVTAHELRWVRIGALAELWGVLIGAFAMFGARRRVEPVLIEVSSDAEGDLAGNGAAEDAEPEDEVRYDKRMEDILRREIRSVLTRELTVLRAQVAALRSDVLERIQPDEAPAVAEAIRTTQRRLATLSQHDIAPAGEPVTASGLAEQLAPAQDADASQQDEDAPAAVTATADAEPAPVAEPVRGATAATEVECHGREPDVESSAADEVPHDAADVPSGGADVPSGGADVPSDGADVPSDGAEVPSGGADVPSDEAEPSIDGPEPASAADDRPAAPAVVADHSSRVLTGGKRRWRRR
jgi:hypothetical protein